MIGFLSSVLSLWDVGGKFAKLFTVVEIHTYVDRWIENYRNKFVIIITDNDRLFLIAFRFHRVWLAIS